ncbi:MAG TPA: hypothetical protein VLJ21_00105 [Candidatus Binatia bacterium]|nr:hypothetical protein [Candidatus Binatia bacterium]
MDIEPQWYSCTWKNNGCSGQVYVSARWHVNVYRGFLRIPDVPQGAEIVATKASSRDLGDIAALLQGDGGESRCVMIPDERRPQFSDELTFLFVTPLAKAKAL